MNITIDCKKDIEFRYFWKSTGFTPADWLLRPCMKQYIQYVGSIPFKGIQYIRIHNLLNLVKISNITAETPECDWSKLDEGLDLIVDNGLKPVFELMGNPSGCFKDFNNLVELKAWRRFIRDLIVHLENRYGKHEVRSWYFESWNEPDINWGYKWVNPEAFCKYYDACCSGICDVDDKIRLGGPGTAKTLSQLFKIFLQHCEKDKNYLTESENIKLDFISVHEKGVHSCREDITPSSSGICLREKEILDYIKKNHPALSSVPFMNNECDPIVGWGDIHTWHALPYYAAFVVKSISQHQKFLIDKKECNYELLSNDNGFLGTWGNRTLLATLGIVPSEMDMNERFELIKKPVFNVMVALGMLGSRRLSCDIELDPMKSNIDLIPTIDDDCIAILVYNSDDKIFVSSSSKIDIRIVNLPFTRFWIRQYEISENVKFPFRIWESNGAPRDMEINAELLRKMKEAEELTVVEEAKFFDVKSREINISFELPLPGVRLIMIVPEQIKKGKAKISNLRLFKYRGLTEFENVMLVWDNINDRYCRTYEVLFSRKKDRDFNVVNSGVLLCSAYTHIRQHDGYYKVRAIGLNGEILAESDVVKG